jgi:hypothetical protein
MKLAGLWKKPSKPVEVPPRLDVLRAPAVEPVRTESEDYGVASETLAQIMVSQGKLVEAKKIYIQMARTLPERYEELSQKIQDIEYQLQSKQ